ncbi:MAG TPA: hypothetical protein VMH81_07230 [Bryobacteraceae bacterium]|nr:hypothetical protein [Bryobacteraceae bacterium]
MKLRVLSHAPDDLTRERLVRLGEGINKVVYASGHWVVKRERRPTEIITLICVWKFLRRVDHFVPGELGRRILEKPGKQIRILRLIFQALVLPIPRSFWLATHIGSLWRWHSSREAQGQRLADAYLAGTPLMPACVSFPPTRVKVGGWPGWLVVSEAMERVESTLQDRINDLARSLRFDDIEVWLGRFLDQRVAGWQRGVFSMDPHLKNYGVIGDRVVLLDAGGLTNNWLDIQKRLGTQDEFDSPHVRLGLEMTLRDRPDIAERFDARWRATVNAEVVSRYWPCEFRPHEGEPVQP